MNINVLLGLLVQLQFRINYVFTVSGGFRVMQERELPRGFHFGRIMGLLSRHAQNFGAKFLIPEDKSAS